jgi:predicted membrane GTPase involved in stress response
LAKAATSIQLEEPGRMNLQPVSGYIGPDELVEATPNSLVYLKGFMP